MPDRLTQLQGLVVNRVALVGAGDNPAADMVLWKVADYAKAKYSAEDRQAMADKGQAMKDGSYPIMDAQDMASAVGLVGRGKASTGSVRNHIIARAKSLGLTSKLPSEWIGKEAPLLERMEQARAGSGPAPADRRKEDHVAEDTAEYQLPDETPDELKKYVESLEAQRDAATSELEKVKAEKAAPIEPDPQEKLEKALQGADPVIQEALRKAQADAEDVAKAAEEANAKIDKMLLDQANAAAIAKAQEWRHLPVKPSEFGPKLAKLRTDDPELAAAVEQMLGQANAVTSEFGEIGKTQAEMDAETTVRKMETDYAEAHKVTPQQAAAQLAQTSAEYKGAVRELQNAEGD